MSNKIEFNKDFPSIKKSDDLYNRALNLIPSVTQTLAKGPQQNVKGIAPKYLQKGKGSHVWDVDGNEYLDFNMARCLEEFLHVHHIITKIGAGFLLG